ncbi:uncharacterized protein LOC110720849 isoform X4 [Chenopodium quinoa]|uniref:uncharacterized protein LOC110720849 isoform X4 n=1 Tax=Chenopodium quinoa TaxID=63459 RepID=UPI000B77C6D9|nr:uncharacterized protein LOC110720849 isoform X4 [Chenopodium quinoa]XP_021755612.1 uncharacterized protein LOC110720849 isoform X4 [Chenopodium quinoa]XP_021755613.1 uncharacterized protein LOC110720849 isoform X4 [Chenopodium quinoa]
MDQRVYNAPTSDEVAVIWPDSVSSSQSSWPHVLVTAKSAKSHRIAHFYGCYDPLQYPLLFPRGECGWHQGLKKTSYGGDRQVAAEPDPIQSCAVNTPADFLDAEAARASGRHTKADKNISAREYYTYKLQIRPGNMLLRAGRAFLQYITDMYIKVENTRLDFFRQNQDTIRADLYKGILDTVESGQTSAANVGHKFILPPSFIGGPRDMKRRYLNAMALVQKYGKPDLFVTMTCNANWPEIKAELEPGETAQDRPDLVARIFRAKLIALKQKFKKDMVFGKVAAMIYVVEFQKRGLPHAHFLLILEQQHKMKSPADYDRYVCAEIPPVTQPELCKIVLRHMMHGPCGQLNPECPCMRKKDNVFSCKNGYPKQFTAQTTTNKDGYPCYKRSDTGEQVKVRNAELDNRWVLPYNPYLATLFDCHLNVEVCSTIKAVKYLYKYVYKGHYRVAFNISAEDRNSGDEIAQFQSGRWVSPCEAAWRIFGFDLFEMHPPVLPLSVHIPDMNTVCVRPYERLDIGIASGVYAKTQLTEFFRMNAANDNGLGYLYGEFPEHYKWDASAKTWSNRQNKNSMVGRLAFVAPSEGERFYLRLLLLNVRSPKSFTDLRTVQGYVCETFKEACLKAGILEEDDAASSCLAEATEIQLPGALCRLFATVLIFCQPSDPAELWRKYYPALSEDFAQKYSGAESKIKILTVRSVEQHLEAMGKSLCGCGLAVLVDNNDTEIDRTKDIQDALDAPIPQACIDSRSLLNPAQKEIFTCIMQHIVEGKPGAFFVDGPGGTGKTFLYTALYAEIRLMNKIVLLTATSGIAAANIPSGRTAHSRFKIPMDSDASLACSVSKQSSLAALIKETALIIWDEASMANKQNLETLDLLLQDICNNDVIFGGKVIVFGGDFRQVLPVVPNKTQREAVEASVVSSYIWKHLRRFRLTENLRAKEDPSFCQFLLALGNGEFRNFLILLEPFACTDQKYKTTRQKPEYVYLNQLNAASKAYIVRVVVAEKGRDILSSKKTVRFQTLLLKDEKGNRMRGTLFGDQIEAFDEALQYLGEYDISAAPIKFIDEKWRTELDQFPYQMTFGSRTVIQPVHPELGPILPNYRPIASIPRAVDPDEKNDVVGVVLFVEEEPRKVEARDGKRESWVREIVITDQSCDRSLTISMWNDLTAGKYFDKLPTWAEAFKVIGFTALKPYTRRGFSMNSAVHSNNI